MRTLGASILLGAAASVCCFAQQWEFGGLGGAGFLNNVNASIPAGSATTGFQTGLAAGAFVGQNLYPHVSGELHYEYLQSNLHISSGGQQASFSGNAHALHYDLILHTNKKGSRTQLFVAMGAGLKIFRGTGTEEAYQSLSQFGYMTKTQQLKPMASVGAGVRFTLTNRLYLRTEFRDFITPFPTQLIAPAPGAKFGSILQDFVPMVALSYEF
ncbi:MAG: outer membrane beta-barrel protein [Bryobacteraceae bacterium]